MKYTSSSFQNMDPPRDLSIRMKLAVFTSNMMFITGLIFTLAGSGFFLAFASITDFTSGMNFHDTDPHTRGVVTNVESTSCRENRRIIYKNTAQYTINGKGYSSDSYSRGKTVSEQETVDIQYLANNPAMSVISGQRKAPFGPWISIGCLIFPFLGIILFLAGFRRSKINVDLLKNGLLTSGKITRTEPTSSKVNKQRVYNVFFTFTAQDGNTIESSIRTHKPDLVTDEEKEQLVYDALNPAKAVLIDSLPGSVRRYFRQV